MGKPLFHNVGAVGLYDPQKVAQDGRGDLGVVVAQQRFPPTGDPHFGAVRRGPTLRNVDVDRLQRVAFIGPEVDDIGPDPKNLRH